MNETTPQRLARLRAGKGWSQHDLAKKAGVSQGTIGNLESGIRGYGKSLASIARALNVSTAYLECKTDDPGGTVAQEPTGYSTEALALAWLLDQVPTRIEKVKANSAATAAILLVLQQIGVTPTHTPAANETPTKPPA